MADAILIACAIGLLCCGWALYCNGRTFDQRIDLMPKAGDPLFWEKRVLFHRITYHQHFWSLVFFRDPYKLYDKGLFEK